MNITEEFERSYEEWVNYRQSWNFSEETLDEEGIISLGWKKIGGRCFVKNCDKLECYFKAQEFEINTVTYHLKTLNDLKTLERFLGITS